MTDGKAILFVLALLGPACAAGLCADTVQGRIGFAEEFNSVDGWKIMEEDRPLRDLKVADGRAVLDTWVGSIGDTKPADQPRSLGATSSIVKQYPEEVDLDKYHYIVMKTDEKAGYSILYLNKKEVQVNYTSGVIAQDLRQLGFTGRQRIFFELEVMNTGHQMKVDYIRLVSELTDEEKAGLIPPSIHLYHDDVQRHLYQKLDALNARSARPARAIDEPKAVFRDVGTGAVTWRMTADPSDKGFSEHYPMWRPDGSGFCLHPNGTPYYSYEQNRYTQPPANFYNRELQLQGYLGKDRKETAIHKWNAQTGKWEEACRVRGAGVGVAGSKAALRDDEGSIIIYNGGEADPARRLKTIRFPYKDSKGNALDPAGKHLGFNAPWGSYQHFVVDTDTGEIRNGYLWTFTHGMNGDPYSLMSYGGAAKLAVPSSAYWGTGTPGSELAMYGPYLDLVSTDYGIMTSDGRFGVANGLEGELADQHVMFDRTDPGTILRLATYHVSKVTWAIWTKTVPSPDYTKLTYVSDMLGYSDFYIAVTRLPDAPRQLSARKADGGVQLAWQTPVRCKEIKGYNIYRSDRSGSGYARINRDLVTASQFTDSESPAAAFYLVAAQEYSGLEGLFSQEASVGAGDAPLLLHYPAAEQVRTRPMREVFDGYACGYRAVRLTPVAEGERSGTLSVATGLPRAAKVSVWARVRSYRGGKGRLGLAEQGVHYDDPPAPLAVESKDWVWVRSSGQVSLHPQATLVLTCADDGVAVDQIILAEDDSYRPDGLAERTAPPPPVTGLKVAKSTSDTINLAWDASSALDLYHYSVYGGSTPDFVCGNQTILCSGMSPVATDWGLKSGGRFYYKVVAVNRRGQMSGPVMIEARTAAREPYVQQIPIADAARGAGITLGSDQDIEYAAFRDASSATVAFDFTIPADGDYFLWMDYGVRFAKDRILPLQLDGKDLGTWEAREPARMGRDLEEKEGKIRWFVDRMWLRQGWASKDKIALKAGKHTLMVRLAEKSPWLSKLIVTDDPSLVPQGYSAQVRFNRLRRQP